MIKHSTIGRVRYVEYINESELEGDNIALICCPGFSASASTLVKHLLPIADLTRASHQYRVVGIDWRGHGAAVSSEEQLTVISLADDLYQLILYIISGVKKQRKVSLLGHSMGVNVIWHLVSKYGDEFIDRFIFVDQPVAITGGVDAFTAGYKREWIIHSMFVAHALSLLIYLLAPIWRSVLRVRALRPSWLSDESATFMSKHSPYLGKLLVDTSVKVITSF